MDPLLIIAVSLQPGGRMKSVGKVTASPLSVRRAGRVLKMRHPEKFHQHFDKCILKLNTK